MAPDGTPSRSYLLCHTARSGSTFLAQLLADTGVLGEPSEYLNPIVRDPLAAEWGCEGSRRGYLEHLHRERVTPNGVFAVKAAWHQLQAWQEEVRGAPPADPYELDESCLDALLPSPHLIRIVRRDLVAQAVSYYVALRTNRWVQRTGDDEGEAEPPPYDFEAIDGCLRFLETEEVAWDRFLRRTDIPARTVEYEQVREDPDAAVADLARWLGVEAPARAPEQRLTVQRTPATIGYADRYRQERLTRGRGKGEWLSRMAYEAGLRNDAADGGLQRLADLSEAHERLSAEVERLRARDRLLAAILDED